jgi:hypothetical protein
VDIISLPAALPFIVDLVIWALRRSARKYNSLLPAPAVFALLWLVPEGIYRAAAWGTPGFPLYIVLAPLLWNAEVLGLAFFCELFARGKVLSRLIAGVGAAALPCLAAFCWQQFFAQNALAGWLLLVICLAPAVLFVLRLFAARRPEEAV